MNKPIFQDVPDQVSVNLFNFSKTPDDFQPSVLVVHIEIRKIKEVHELKLILKDYSRFKWGFYFINELVQKRRVNLVVFAGCENACNQGVLGLFMTDPSFTKLFVKVITGGS